MKPFHLCKPYLLSKRRILVIYVSIVLLTAVISIMPPYIIGGFLDMLISGAEIRVILRFCIVLTPHTMYNSK